MLSTLRHFLKPGFIYISAIPICYFLCEIEFFHFLGYYYHRSRLSVQTDVGQNKGSRVKLSKIPVEEKSDQKPMHQFKPELGAQKR